MLSVLLAGLVPTVLASVQCSDDVSTSCSGSAGPKCCDPTAGLFLFKQRFEPDAGDGGQWGIDGVDVLKCDGSPATEVYSPRYDHEHIASLCLRSELIGGEEGYLQAEEEWAQSEVGEGVEERWDATWNTAGRFISTLASDCTTDSVPAFFNTLHLLHERFRPGDLLDAANITPDETLYSLDEITAALTVDGVQPLVTCVGSTLSSVIWPLHSHGPFQDAKFELAEFILPSTCPYAGISYPVTTTLVVPTTTFDPIFRPTPRPITLSHDESRLYYKPEKDDESPDRQDPRRLGIFKARGEEMEERKEKRANQAYWRDEL